ncbi:MAG: M48 family metallopeptidase [Pseudohongiellaceae bacterium]
MNFFASQESAKKNTTKLYLLFVVAILSLIVVTNVFVMFLFGFASTQTTSMAATQSWVVDWEQFLVVGGAVAAIVLLGSLYKINALSGGGARIAEMMNGRLLLGNGENLQEQQLLNVVEEMAIASGVPVPPVYLLEEEGINAFAAGYDPSDAVIGVSAGAVKTLNRDQLQGVIAHEFSHILHGDMKINIRLIGVLHGILILAVIGRQLLYTRPRVRSSRSKGQGAQIALGLGLLVIGYIGVFFGNIIKAAVSRQREYLADASAVQFTRNPEGIAGALMQIAQHSQRSYLNHPASSEISHTLFEENAPSYLSGMYATHPPLEERIRAILPRWTGSYDLVTKANVPPSEPSSAGVETEETQQEKMSSVLTSMGGAIVAGELIKSVGNPTEKHIESASRLIDEMPDTLLCAAREPSSARAVIYFLLLHSDVEQRQAQLSLIEKSSDVGVYGELERLMAGTKTVDAAERYPAVSIALSSLRQLSKQQYELFKSNVLKLITLDSKVSLFEWSIQKTVFHSLDAVFEKPKTRRYGKKALEDSLQSASILLSILVYSNKHQGLSPSHVFAQGQENLSLAVELIPQGSIGFELLNDALDDLASIKPLQKPALLKACAAVITADGKTEPIEIEMLRAIAATIDCPMPPLSL